MTNCEIVRARIAVAVDTHPQAVACAILAFAISLVSWVAFIAGAFGCN